MELVNTLFASLAGTDPSQAWILRLPTANRHTGMKALFSNLLTSPDEGKSSSVLTVLRDCFDMMSH